MKTISTLQFATVAFFVVSTGCQALAQSAPFAGMAGSWTGAGTISLSDGSKERVRCKATYQVGRADARLQQSLRCASDSYRFELNSDLVSEQGQIAGSWSELSRGINGSLVGRESGGTISAVADAPGFSATLSVSTKGNRQNFSIASEGDIRNVSIVMSRN
ncbi:hypothetical protein [Rhodopseudomonas sp. P2A-2r]|uniref:hypothetical protein n=1 Tax=unclassified Rhodopseudomonas TaxID=2638247 RepID=UPI00223421C4|nr:hypothetical protein [Rhodopseudomonas sp. P2A-2r]UZE50762.1 hypothetical protein ONR75_09040 [Rhodopseudomonas sp. P2A-2r]